MSYANGGAVAVFFVVYAVDLEVVGPVRLQRRGAGWGVYQLSSSFNRVKAGYGAPPHTSNSTLHQAVANLHYFSFQSKFFRKKSLPLCSFNEQTNDEITNAAVGKDDSIRFFTIGQAGG